ncbi:MAG: hypothetical protein H6716_23510 [Polyangiaceae bacterium]|nr:hypothetical protein [Polyangiaceae bacterium]
MTKKKSPPSSELDDDLEQLLTGLKLPQIQLVLQRELARAETEAPSYAEFLRRILREEFQAQQMRFLEHRLRRAKLPERWSLLATTRNPRNLTGPSAWSARGPAWITSSWPLPCAA